jgi:hypothetical protein
MLIVHIRWSGAMTAIQGPIRFKWCDDPGDRSAVIDTAAFKKADRTIGWLLA